MFVRPARKLIRGQSSLSRQAALALGVPLLIATGSGDVLKEAFSRSSTNGFHTKTSRAHVLKSWMLLKKLRYDGIELPLCRKQPL